MKYWIILGSVALAACADDQSTIMKKWIGSSDTALMSKWGAPDLTAQGGGGARILTYHGRDAAGRVHCRRTFTVNAQHVVTAAADDCPPGWLETTR